MINQLQKILSHQNNLKKEDKLILAISGGVDSMVMLHLFYSLKYEIVVAHCNFQLRGEESDLDENLVRDAAVKLDIPFYSIRFDTNRYAKENKLSIQLAARELRYIWFHELKTEIKADWILTAHHADDQIETFFINLIRGSGIKGLSGIPKVNEDIFRPLLHFSRHDILIYANEYQIAFREDASNAESKYLRNKIRKNILPLFKELAGNELLPIRKSISYLGEVNHFYQDRIQEAIKEFTIQKDSQNHFLDKHRLLKSPQGKQVLTEFLVAKAFPSARIRSIQECLKSTESKTFYSGDYKLLVERDRICLLSYSPELDEELSLRIYDGLIIRHPLHLEFNIETINADFHLSKDPFCVHLDADLVGDEVFLRKWKPGDRFMPLGMKNEKKISDFFIDSKFDSLKKSDTYLLLANQQVVWVIGERPDERYKVSSQTVKVLQIKLKSLD